MKWALGVLVLLLGLGVILGWPEPRPPEPEGDDLPQRLRTRGGL